MRASLPTPAVPYQYQEREKISEEGVHMSTTQAVLHQYGNELTEDELLDLAASEDIPYL